MSRILVVDDDPGLCELVAADLRDEGYAVEWVVWAEEAMNRILAEDYDVVVTDIHMPGLGGIDFCRRVREHRPDLPVIVITGFGSLDSAVHSIRAGAYDFVSKPFERETLSLAVARAAEARSLKTELRRIRSSLPSPAGFAALLGESPAMRNLFALLEKVSSTDSSVLVTGETGTGKELVARAVHEKSGRSRGPFIAFSCAAMPAQLVESELFGHARGAFTDARTSRPGLFLRADGGSLFLDEVGEMPLELQPKLLRALQERTVHPLGGAAELPFDARLIAATNRDLESAVEDGRFRRDLLFRLNVITVEIPPLRARGNDVLLLAQHFLGRAARRTGRKVEGITAPAADRLLAYPWPGNVRELENCIERSVALSEHSWIVLEDLPEKIRRWQRSQLIVDSDDPDELITMQEVEKRYILRVFSAVAGNKAKAARVLDMDRKTLYRKLERFGVLAPEKSGGEERPGRGKMPQGSEEEP